MAMNDTSAPIPENYQSGVNLLGKTFKIVNLVEAGVLGLGGAFGSFTLMDRLGFAKETSIATCLVVALPLLYLGLVGVYDEPLHEAIKNIVLFFKNRRSVKYNPKPKKNAEHVNLFGEEVQTEMLPRDVIMQKYESFKKKMDESSRKKMLDSQQNDGEMNVEFIFDDDEELLEKYNVKKKIRGDKGEKENN